MPVRWDPRTSDLDSSVVSSSSGSAPGVHCVCQQQEGATPPTRSAGGLDGRERGPAKSQSPSAVAECRESGAARDAATQGGGDTGYGETSSSEEQDSSWSRSSAKSSVASSAAESSSSSSPSSSSSGSGGTTTTASGALASVSDDQDDPDDTQAEDGDDDDDDDDEVDLSKLEVKTRAAPFSWPPTTVLQARILQAEEEAGESEADTEEPGTSEQLTSTETEEQLPSLDAEDASQATAASDRTADHEGLDDVPEQQPEEGPSEDPSQSQSEAQAQATHPAEPPLPPTPQFLRPTIEIDSSDILHRAKFLAMEGADVAALDPTSYTAMHLAAMNGHNGCLEVLLKMGADVDNITADGFTPLHLAALNNYADCVRTLLSWGANLAVEDALGRTVQDMVEEYALDDVSALLSGLWTHIDKYTQSRKQSVPPRTPLCRTSSSSSLSACNVVAH
ncbi:hypothetical protein HPB48_020587 [Haemaphysalis longicornis]|uniref:Uncharacterized protein n=1 Tax=Haemaphysalis longicornis TaxID=44386 RepID=A0A9J6FRY2_HAELO|nr:hypothetical protein HPB48_020587 [Haemaphysalis longicornis]